jgi:predicted Zn finger-like uncharacterized protein
MKITCQACQSKYTIADDKIQGKVAKIRCRKCGATVLVDASSGGGAANGSGSGDAWMVSVAEGDQRTMQLQEVIDAYNSGVITGDTYLWKDGMGDWLPLSEVAEIVEALNAASEGAAPPQEDYSAPAQDYNPPAPFSPPAPAVAARRETGRGRGDLFGGKAHEEEVATSAPVQVTPRGASAGRGAASSGGAAQASASTDSRLTGQRDEQSVLFSLSALTGGTAKPAAAPAVTASSSSASSGSAVKQDDSGLIDLSALARAQAAKPVEAAPVSQAPSPFLFPAALGNVETFQIPDQPKKSSMPLILGGGVVVVLLAVVIFVFAGKKDEIPPLPAGAALSAAAVAPEPPPTPTPSAEAAPAESAPVATKTPKKGGGGGGAVRPKPGGGGGATPPSTPLPPPKAKSPCGCSSGDLQCQIRCSATGH